RFAPQLIRINPREAILPSKGGVSIAENAVIGIQNIYQILVE
ncbi:MAG: NAD-dependent deacetylase, partial [Acinetobacter sp.]